MERPSHALDEITRITSMKPRKICLSALCKRFAFSHGYCERCQDQRTDLDYFRKKAAREGKAVKKVSIRKEAPKRAKENRQYSKDRAEFLSRPENQFCRVYPWLEATTVHHGKGRIGKLLLDQRWWVPLSPPGHSWAEENPEEAKAMGISFDRLANDDEDDNN